MIRRQVRWILLSSQTKVQALCQTWRASFGGFRVVLERSGQLFAHLWRGMESARGKPQNHFTREQRKRLPP
jgi:hypothetical protein